MLNFHGFSAWVCIDGIRRDGNGTTEYDIEVSEADKTVTCWIASELGKNFSVHWKTSTYQGDIGGYVKMDGVSCAGKILRAHRLPRDTFKEGVTEGQTLRRFAFSSLSLTDDDEYLGAPSQTLPDLGVIDLDIYPIRVNGSKRRVMMQQTNLATLKVHERSKKAVTQQVTLTKAEYLPKPSSCIDVTLTGPAFVKFRFKYRPMDVLRANGIAPQAPKAKVPTPPPETHKENKPLVKHEKKDAKKSKVKREADEDVIDLTEDTSRPKNKKVKLENFVQGEVIDLT